MHTTTFYSYKGGVGRTLALMNVAIELVNSGENVFLIDFDLEAPGLQTFQPFNYVLEDRDHNEIKGLSDIVHEFISNPSAGVPSLKSHVIRGDLSRLPKTIKFKQDAVAKPGKLFLLPAGTKSAFANINWRQLYEENEGFLFFEGLKQRIKDDKTFSPTWLFVDSRTGRAETTGICTRQLADTNVLLFFPNEQNRIGFEEIFPKMANDQTRDVEGVEPLHFIYVASRVPTTDDEEDILLDEMNEFRGVFGLPKINDHRFEEDEDENIITLPHNNAVELLQQSLFVIERPNSQLGKSYKKLAVEVAKRNPESLVGSTNFLRSIADKPMRILYRHEPDKADLIERQILEIAKTHSTSADINDGLSIAYAALSATGSAEIEDSPLTYRALWHAAVFRTMQGKDKKTAMRRRIGRGPHYLQFGLNDLHEVSLSVAIEEGYQAFRRDTSPKAILQKAYSGEEYTPPEGLNSASLARNIIEVLADASRHRLRNRPEQSLSGFEFSVISGASGRLPRDFLLEQIFSHITHKELRASIEYTFSRLAKIEHKDEKLEKRIKLFEQQVFKMEQLSDYKLAWGAGNKSPRLSKK